MAKRSDRRLSRFAGRHLAYEITMLFNTGAVLQRGAGTQFATNVLVESFGLHLRTVIEFLYDYSRWDDDVGAEEYVKDEQVWRRARRGMPRRLKAAARRAGKQLHHLTLKRYRSGKRKGWPVAALLADILPPLRTFSEHALPSRLPRRVRRLIAEVGGS
jgi:hypothetical protein